MPSTDALEAAGRRAAFGPVPNPPSIEALAAEVDRRRSKRRRVVGGVTAALVAAVAIPVGVSLVDDGQADVMTLASDDGGEALSSEPASSASQTEPSPASAPTTVSPSTTLPDDVARGPLAGLSDENFDLRLDLGDESYAIVVLRGEEALPGADAAAAAADETREIDGRVIWLDEQGDELVASALVDDDMFVQVTGPAQQIEQILDLVTAHATGPLKFFDLDGFGEQFDLPEGFLDGDGSFAEDFPFEDGDLPFLEDGALEEFRGEMRDFAECMEITVDRTGSTTKIEVPDCEFPELDGLLNDVPFDLEKLFDDLDNAGAD